VIFRSPFQPFLAVDNDDEPVRSRQADAFRPFAPFASRTEAAAKALEQAERDLEASRHRSAEADRKNERRAQLEKEATLAERKRIVAILTSPVALRHPRIAKRVALESDSPADEAIAALEQYERENAASRAKSTADLIVLAGKKMRGEIPCDVNAGPKKFTKFSAEEILAAARKRDGK
jgi:hypothetical protein